VSSSVSEACFKPPFKLAAICPEVMSVAVGLAVLVVASEDIPIAELFSALSVFEAILELPLVAVSIDPGVHPVAIGLAVPPLSDVGVPLCALPEAGAVLEPVLPLALVYFPGQPLIDAEAIGLAVEIGALKGGSVRKLLEALAVFEVGLPLTLVLPAGPVEDHPRALPLPVHKPPAVDRPLVPPDGARSDPLLDVDHCLKGEVRLVCPEEPFQFALPHLEKLAIHYLLIDERPVRDWIPQKPERQTRPPQGRASRIPGQGRTHPGRGRCNPPACHCGWIGRPAAVAGCEMRCR
jgi:hypothetical protein